MSDDQKDQCMNSSKVKPINHLDLKAHTQLENKSLIHHFSDLSRKIQPKCQNLERICFNAAARCGHFEGQIVWQKVSNNFALPSDES